jgi:endoglucanase
MFQLTRALRSMLIVLSSGAVMTLAGAAAPATAENNDRGSTSHVRFHIRAPNAGALQQIYQLLRQRQYRSARLLTQLILVPQATWLVGGSPQEVAQQTKQTLVEAKFQRATAVFALYNIPGRDCGGYSGGGAQTTPAYAAWIDAIASTIGDREAIVILEPDALANLPVDCGYDPTGQLTVDRYAQLRHAIDALGALPRTRVYLDAGHSGWHSVGTIASRLAQAGVANTSGFYLNVSNYQPTPAQTKYGTWISNCIAFASDPSEGGWRLGHYDYCASQYFPASADDYSTWTLTDEWYANNLSGPPQNPTHFVIDTSRNGQEHASNSPSDPTYATEPPGRMTLYAQPPYNQPSNIIATLAAGSWCNLRGAGAGARPTSATGNPLVDAYLWVKIVGESDGPCSAAGGVRAWDYSVYTEPGWPTIFLEQQTFDPTWGRADPAAGAWFPEQALELAEKAVPRL